MRGPKPQVDGVNWIAQVGPQLSGQTTGYALGAANTFFVSPGPGSDANATYAYYLSDDTGQWIPIPNRTVVTAPGINMEWQILPPPQGLSLSIGIPTG